MSSEAERKARELVNTMGKAFRAELVAQRKDKLAAGVDFGSGAVWGGSEAQRIGLIDEVATIEQVVKTRWPGLPVTDLGPRNSGLPFAVAAADWVGQVISRVATHSGSGIAMR
jgi:protease-4